jgi:hypothetical protein
MRMLEEYLDTLRSMDTLNNYIDQTAQTTSKIEKEYPSKNSYLVYAAIRSLTVYRIHRIILFGVLQ